MAPNTMIDPAWDAAEAEHLYTLLEREVIPAFYDRDEAGIPVGWINRMRESMALLTPQFSSNRAVREYTEKHYIPLAAAYLRRSTDGNRTAQKPARLEASALTTLGQATLRPYASRNGWKPACL